MRAFSINGVIVTAILSTRVSLPRWKLCRCAMLPAGSWMLVIRETVWENSCPAYAGAGICDTSWCHSLPRGDVNIFSYPCAMEVYVKMKRASNRWSEHQVSKQARCDGLMLHEGVARLKRERKRRLKLSNLLVFFLGFTGFFLICVKLLIWGLGSKNSYNSFNCSYSFVNDQGRNFSII